MTDPVERRRCLVSQDATDVAEGDLDGICIRYRLPEGTMQIAERREPARIIERVEQVAEPRRGLRGGGGDRALAAHGGDEKWVGAAMPALEAMAAKILHVGPSGAGNVAKLVNNMLVASHMVTTLEALRLAQAAGVGAEDALRVINSATGRSAISEIHYPNWVLPHSFDSGFSTGLMRKDVRLARELAQSVGCAMPVADLVADLWAEETSGLKDADDFMHMGDPAVDRLSEKEEK